MGIERHATHAASLLQRYYREVCHCRPLWAWCPLFHRTSTKQQHCYPKPVYGDKARESFCRNCGITLPFRIFLWHLRIPTPLARGKSLWIPIPSGMPHLPLAASLLIFLGVQSIRREETTSSFSLDPSPGNSDGISSPFSIWRGGSISSCSQAASGAVPAYSI